MYSMLIQYVSLKYRKQKNNTLFIVKYFIYFLHLFATRII